MTRKVVATILLVVNGISIMGVGSAQAGTANPVTLAEFNPGDFFIG